MTRRQVGKEDNHKDYQDDTWHVALYMIIEPYGPVIYQITLLQKQQIKACFLSHVTVYNELNIEKIDMAFALILPSLQIK